MRILCSCTLLPSYAKMPSLLPYPHPMYTIPLPIGHRAPTPVTTYPAVIRTDVYSVASFYKLGRHDQHASRDDLHLQERQRRRAVPSCGLRRQRHAAAQPVADGRRVSLISSCRQRVVPARRLSLGRLSLGRLRRRARDALAVLRCVVTCSLAFSLYVTPDSCMPRGHNTQG